MDFRQISGCAPVTFKASVVAVGPFGGGTLLLIGAEAVELGRNFCARLTYRPLLSSFSAHGSVKVGNIRSLHPFTLTVHPMIDREPAVCGVPLSKIVCVL